MWGRDLGTAIIVAVAVMMLAARPIGEFVDRHPSVKVLALAFLGAESLRKH